MWSLVKKPESSWLLNMNLTVSTIRHPLSTSKGLFAVISETVLVKYTMIAWASQFLSQWVWSWLFWSILNFSNIATAVCSHHHWFKLLPKLSIIWWCNCHCSFHCTTTMSVLMPPPVFLINFLMQFYHICCNHPSLPYVLPLLSNNVNSKPVLKLLYKSP